MIQNIVLPEIVLFECEKPLTDEVMEIFIVPVERSAADLRLSADHRDNQIIPADGFKAFKERFFNIKARALFLNHRKILHVTPACLLFPLIEKRGSDFRNGRNKKDLAEMSEMDERKSKMIYYASKYGTSEQIAHWLSEKLALDVQNLEETDFMNRDELPVRVMPMYASVLYKSRKALSLLRNAGLNKAIVVTFGLSDPKRPDTKAALQVAVLRAFLILKQ